MTDNTSLSLSRSITHEYGLIVASMWNFDLNLNWYRNQNCCCSLHNAYDVDTHTYAKNLWWCLKVILISIFARSFFPTKSMYLNWERRSRLIANWGGFKKKSLLLYWLIDWIASTKKKCSHYHFRCWFKPISSRLHRMCVGR